jgi:hypothetical protein
MAYRLLRARMFPSRSRCQSFDEGGVSDRERGRGQILLLELNVADWHLEARPVKERG